MELGLTAPAYEGLALHYLLETNYLAAGTNYLTAARFAPLRYELVGKAGLWLVYVPEQQAEGRDLLTRAVDKAKARMATAWTPVIAADLGLYQAALGQADEACLTFEKAFREEPSDTRPRYELSEAIERLENQGETNAARRLQQLLDKSAPAGHSAP